MVALSVFKHCKLHHELALIDLTCTESILGWAATQPDEQSKQSPDSFVGRRCPSGVTVFQYPGPQTADSAFSMG